MHVIFWVWHQNRSGILQVSTKSDYTELINLIWPLFPNFNQSSGSTKLYLFWWWWRKWHCQWRGHSVIAEMATGEIAKRKYNCGPFLRQNSRKLYFISYKMLVLNEVHSPRYLRTISFHKKWMWLSISLHKCLLLTSCSTSLCIIMTDLITD